MSCRILLALLFLFLAPTTRSYDHPFNPTRRDTLRTAASTLVATPAFVSTPFSASLRVVTDPATYSALVYEPPGVRSPPPLLVVLSGAGNNKGEIMRDMASISGEQGGLPSSLIASGKAPESLYREFTVVQPYPAGKASFYEEPRGKLLSFLDWFCSDAGREAGCPRADKARVALWGFSDGATCAVELATTGRFASCVVAAPGLTGPLPPRAVELLNNQPLYFLHAIDDEVFPISGTDRLVDTLRAAGNTRVRYSRLESGGHRGAGLAAASRPDIYEWFSSL